MNFVVNRAAQSRELIGAAVDWLRTDRRTALVTLVGVEGNAPYPIGSQMLVDDSGNALGQITGGCAETAIVDHAVLAIRAQQNQQHRYGLHSPFFDIQLPCGSGIDVYFDVGLTLSDALEIHRQLEARSTVVRRIQEIDKTYFPTPRLLVFGQGPILLRLAMHARECGFEVVCVAQHKETLQLLSEHRLEGMTLSSCSDIAGSADEFTGVISLFHEHDQELPILQSALESNAFYIGALGSQRTHAARLESLNAHGVSTELSARIHGPVGIDIGAITPGQIAVSILADVIREMNAREALDYPAAQSSEQAALGSKIE